MRNSLEKDKQTGRYHNKNGTTSPLSFINMFGKRWWGD